jgi:putative aldouronate transport system permease protein
MEQSGGYRGKHAVARIAFYWAKTAIDCTIDCKQNMRRTSMPANASPASRNLPHMKKPGARAWLKQMWNSRTLLLMCTPAILFFVVFCYIPMPGAYIAFVNFNYAAGIFNSPFVGFKNFEFLLSNGQLWQLTLNTVLYNVVFIITGSVAQIGLALMLNEMRSKWFKKVSQTFMFLPYFISFVLVGLFTYNFLSFDNGTINRMLESFGMGKIKFFSEAAYWPWILTFINLWKGAGYGSIVYLATIMGLDTSIVEAAQIDGANELQKIRYIIIPWLRPTFVILTLFAIGGILKGNFGLFYNTVGANNVALYKATDIIETFVFRSLVVNFNFSMGSAVGLYQSFFGLIIVLLANWGVKKIEPDYALF